MPVHTPVTRHRSPAAPGRTPGAAEAPRALDVLRATARAGEVVHVEHIPGQDGTTANWPDSVHPGVAAALADRGIVHPWTHQAQAAALALDGLNVIIATRAASGKSAGYLAAALSAVLGGGTALYIAPAKALAVDQLKAVRDLAVPGVRAACHDGDSTAAERSWAQAHANYLLTNPDMLHASMLPGHARWRGFFTRLRVVVVDECHAYRGVFGSHVAQVLRRLRRIAAHHGGREPVFILASATIGDPERCARLLTGLEVTAVTSDASPRAPLTFVAWEPSRASRSGQPGASRRPAGLPPPGPGRHPPAPGRQSRRSAAGAASDLLAELVGAGVPAIAFVRSRRGAESVALTARAGGGGARVAAYRSGYLADDRRDLEAGLREGAITGMVATAALELGINVPGLDAVLIAGWPGTRASLWQQAGRAGRAGRPALAVFIAGDDPLDSYLVHHPEALLRHAPEPAVLDPFNPYILAPHLAAAAAELPLTGPDLALFGETDRPALPALDILASAGDIRQRRSGWHWARRGHPARRVGLRGDGNARPVKIVEESTGRLVGTMDEPSAHHLAHDGAVYLHQGETYLVSRLDLADRAALVECRDPGYATRAREVADIKVINDHRSASWGKASVGLGEVRVSRQVVAFARISPEGAHSAFREPETALSLPPRELTTRAFWLAIPGAIPSGAGAPSVPPSATYAAAHAVEHAALGLLPLFAACDQWDVAGTSVVEPSGEIRIYVYDAQQGGAGFAERGFDAAREWLAAARDAIASCPCDSGCPSCVQSARCGTGNSPLSKAGAVALLRRLLAGAA